MTRLATGFTSAWVACGVRALSSTGWSRLVVLRGTAHRLQAAWPRSPRRLALLGLARPLGAMIRHHSNVAVALSLALLLSGCQAEPSESEDFRAAYEHGWAVEVMPGEPVTDGLEVLYLDTPGEATITDVSFTPQDSGVEIVGVAILGPEDREMGATQLAAGFPPAPAEVSATVDTYDDAVGYTVTYEGPRAPADDPEAMEGYQLLIGIAAETLGRFERKTIEVTYEMDGARRLYSIPAELIVCSGSRIDATGLDCADSPSVPVTKHG